MRLREIIQKALEIGGQRGFITFDQLNDLCDGNPKLEPVNIEALMAALNDEGINIIDEESQRPHLSCLFCGKARPEVLRLLAEASGFICNECVRLCVQCIAVDHPEWSAELKTLLDDPAGKNRPA